MSYLFADGTVASGACMNNSQCESTLNLQCSHPSGFPDDHSFCRCIDGYYENDFGQCVDNPPTGIYIEDKTKMSFNATNVVYIFTSRRSGTTLQSKVKQDCLWKDRTHKITKIGDSVCLNLFK